MSRPVFVRGAKLAVCVAFCGAVAFYVLLLLKPRQPDHFRYKMTVVVGVDGGEVSKSGVIGVDRTWTRDWLLRWHHQTKVDGEAVYVDLGEAGDGRQRNIIALLVSKGRDGQGQGTADRWPYWGRAVMGTVDLGPAHYPWWEGATEDTGPRSNQFDAAPIKERAELPRDHYPLLVIAVHERYVSAPRSEKLLIVRRSSKEKDDFYNGHAVIKSVFVGPSTEPVTHTLLSRLPWLGDEVAVRRILPAGSTLGLNKTSFIRNQE